MTSPAIILTVALAFALLLTGCDQSPGPDPVLEGTWKMEAVDGMPLPLTSEFEHPTWGSCRVMLISGAISLWLDHRFVLETLRNISCVRDGAPTLTQEDPEHLAGTYTMIAEQLTFRVNDPTFGEMRFHGDLRGNDLAVDMDGSEILFVWVP